MSWPRKSLFLALFFLSSPWGSADTITVNTTTDDNLDNSLCSLREAVEYFNRGKPEGGYQGCEAPSADSFTVIKLPADTDPYLITSEPIRITTGLSITGDAARGESVTTVQVSGAHRAFVIAFNPNYLPPDCGALGCSPASDPANPTKAPAPDLDPESDVDEPADLTVDNPNDFLTFVQYPELTGTIPGTHNDDESYVIRIYDNPKTGEPVKLGEETFTPSVLTDPLVWSMRSGVSLDAGVHYLTYTIERINSDTEAVIQPESAHSLPMTLAVYPRDLPIEVTLSDLVLKGGKAACTTLPAVTCATNEDDNSLINDPANTATYDRYALSYRNFISGTSGNGGVIFNTEALILSAIILQDGEAQNAGGGVYSTGNAGVYLRSTEIRENQAASGAAVYSALNALRSEQSLVTANVAPGFGSIVEIGSHALTASFGNTHIQNSTFSGNTGVALSLRDNTAADTSSTVTVDNVTVVLNTGGGIDLNNSDVTVKNSIIAGNQDPAQAAGVYKDCDEITTGVISYILMVSGGGCPAPTTTNRNQAISDTGTEILMATLDAEDRCNSATGILCPLADHGGTTFVHMPRLLPSYTSVSDSPLINRGSANCAGVDQRGEARNVACDIGSVEVIGVASGALTRSGGVIRLGNDYEQFLGDGLADEELLTASECLPGVVISGATYPPAQWADSSTALAQSRIVADSYNPNEPGCPWLVTEPGRGDVDFERVDPVTGALMPAGQGYYTYRTNTSFHGFDRFQYRVVTTLSRLNPLVEDRSRLVEATVVVEPPNDLSTDKLGGALDYWGMLLLGMLGLGWRSRRPA